MLTARYFTNQYSQASILSTCLLLPRIRLVAANLSALPANMTFRLVTNAPLVLAELLERRDERAG